MEHRYTTREHDPFDGMRKKAINIGGQELSIKYVPLSDLKPAPYNPRVWTKDATEQLTQSIQKFGMVDPLLVNSNAKRRGIVIGGNFRTAVLKKLGIKDVPVVWVDIADPEKEKELCVRLNKNTGEFDWDLLADFGENFLADVGFSSEELDDVFDVDETPEVFDLAKELKKLQITEITVHKGDRYQLGRHVLQCGDSTVETEMLALMAGEKADLCFTDPPYILDYLKGKKRNGKATEGFGLKRDRKYLETDVLTPDFTEKWMAGIAKIQKPDFAIMIFEHPKNLRTIWNEMEKHWKYRNTVVWHLPNRVQGFSAKYKLFNKHDIALVGTRGDVQLNLDPENDPLFQQEYENALLATSGKPHWEGYGKKKKYCPTDFIEYIAADAKSSGQGIIFGTKPVEILLPYLKVLTKRDAIVVEPFGGSGSTLIACERMRRRCYLMEKVPTYAAVIMKRWEKLTGLKAKKLA